jgi:type I restriction-modification system DNA methylase subunit
VSSQFLTKSKDRIRDHGEVFTPDFIVDDMLNLVHQETQRIESRFLEPACGDGNFLASILVRKISVVDKIYKKNQFDYEKNALLAVSSLYGIDLL